MRRKKKPKRGMRDKKKRELSIGVTEKRGRVRGKNGTSAEP